MANKNTTIEINGKRYNALTGTPLNGPKRRGSIDGVIKSDRSSHPTQPATKPRPVPVSPKPIKSVVDVRPRRTPAVNAKVHTAKPAHTLMRHAVSKPAAGLKQRVRTQPPLQTAVVKPAQIEPKLSWHTTDPKRLARAARVNPSAAISRFSASAEPVHQAKLATTVSKTLRHPAIQTPHHTPALGMPSRPAPSMDIFERALTNATSHEQPAPAVGKRRATSDRSRVGRFSSVALAVLLLGGFLAYQNVNNIKLRVASSRAGFSASLPGYRPAGFSLNKLSYSPGTVALNFHSNSDDRHFALTEQSSNWDSQTLLNDYVASVAGNQYHSVDAAGRTVYVYGDNNATWVNNGVWYQVKNSDALSSKQLSELASSM